MCVCVGECVCVCGGVSVCVCVCVCVLVCLRSSHLCMWMQLCCVLMCVEAFFGFVSRPHYG